MKRKGKFFIISSNIGCYATHLEGALFNDMKRNFNFEDCPVYTTRKQRPEEYSNTYHFVSREKFKNMQMKNLFYDVYGLGVSILFPDSSLFGSPKKDIDEILTQGKNILITCYPKNSIDILKKCKDAVGVFVYVEDDEDPIENYNDYLIRYDYIIKWISFEQSYEELKKYIIKLGG